MANKKIPSINPDRIIKSEMNLSSNTSEDKRLKYLLKGKEPYSITTVRIPEKIKEKLDKLVFYTKRMSMNDHIIEAIKQYLDDDEIKAKLNKQK